MPSYSSATKLILVAGFFVIIPIAIWGMVERHRRALGKDMIEQNDEAGLARLVYGRPSLATTLLEEVVKSERKELFEVLLTNKANIDKATLTTKWGPYPLLLHLAESQEVYWISTALKYGANPNAEWRNTTTPLSGALYGKRPANALAVINAGADVNGRVQDRSYFDVAMTERQFEPAYLLLQKGANSNAVTQKLKSGVECVRECFIPLPRHSKEKNEEVLSNDYYQKILTDPFFQKIVDWYRDHDLDVLNATHSDPTGKTPGVWIIPRFKSSKEPHPD